MERVDSEKKRSGEVSERKNVRYRKKEAGYKKKKKASDNVNKHTTPKSTMFLGHISSQQLRGV